MGHLNYYEHPSMFYHHSNNSGLTPDTPIASQQLRPMTTIKNKNLIVDLLIIECTRWHTIIYPGTQYSITIMWS